MPDIFNSSVFIKCYILKSVPVRFSLTRTELGKDQAKEHGEKTDIGWGHQIRSYVLDQSRIKDLRTNIEVGNTQGVLDGDLDGFIEASLKSSV